MNSRRNALTVVALLLAIGLLSSCATSEREPASRAADHPSPAPAPDMHDVMLAKLVHTQAIVESIVMGDAKRVERNARALVELSERGDWMVHDTLAYVGFSDDFRHSARTLAMHARQGDAEAVTDGYHQLLNSCIACHDYLRRERLIKDMPGRVSWFDSLPRDTTPLARR